MSIEIKELDDFPGYGVSQDGQLWTKKKPNGGTGTEWRNKKTRKVKDGYLLSTMRVGGKVVTARAHRLVLRAFIGPCPMGRQGCHINGDPADNRLANLKYGTPVENESDKLLHGTAAKGENHGQSKISDAEVVKVRELWHNGSWTLDSLSAMFIVGPAQIHHIVTGKQRVGAGGQVTPPKDKQKLASANVDKIIDLSSSGQTAMEIGSRYGVTADHIRKLLKRGSPIEQAHR